MQILRAAIFADRGRIDRLRRNLNLASHIFRKAAGFAEVERVIHSHMPVEGAAA